MTFLSGTRSSPRRLVVVTVAIAGVYSGCKLVGGFEKILVELRGWFMLFSEIITE